MTTEIKIPPEIYQSDKACGEFILSLNERLSQVAVIEKALKEAKEVASNVLLDRLEATGQKHFAFEGLGTFSRKTLKKVSFPTAENGGKEAAVQWLTSLLEKGVITPAQLLDVQQARIVSEPVLAIEEAVEEYNEHQKLNGSDELIPPSPFRRFEVVQLSSPRTRKP